MFSPRPLPASARRPFLATQTMSFALPPSNHSRFQVIPQSVIHRSWFEIGFGQGTKYRDGLKNGPQVARIFCLALPGCCLAKQVHFLAHFCKGIRRFCPPNLRICSLIQHYRRGCYKNVIGTTLTKMIIILLSSSISRNSRAPLLHNAFFGWGGTEKSSPAVHPA